MGNRALANGEAALDAGRETVAAERAREALQWAPWSAQAHRLLAEAQLAGGNARGCSRQSAAGDRRRSTRLDAVVRARTDDVRPRRVRDALAEARRLNPRSPEIAAYVSPANGPAMIRRRRDPLADPEPLIRRVYAYVAYRLGEGAEAEDVTVGRVRAGSPLPGEL